MQQIVHEWRRVDVSEHYMAPTDEETQSAVLKNTYIELWLIDEYPTEDLLTTMHNYKAELVWIASLFKPRQASARPLPDTLQQ